MGEAPIPKRTAVCRVIFAFGKIGPDGIALRLLQELVVKPGSFPIEFQQPRPAAPSLLVTVLLGNFHPGPLGQKPDGIREGEIFLLHDKVDHTAAALAAEAVVDLLIRRNGEGAGFLTVEGTKTKQIGPFAAELHIAADNIYNVVAGNELVHKILGKCQSRSPSFRSVLPQFPAIIL